MPAPQKTNRPPAAVPPAPPAPVGPTHRHHTSVFRGVEALIVLLEAHRSLGITQIAGALQISKSTAHDLLAALIALGFVEQNAATRRYAVSPEIFRFVHLVSTEFGPNSAVKPFLRAQARRFEASIVVTALCRHSTYALCASGPNADTFLLGDNGPAHNSACGKVLVAQFGESLWPDYAPRPGDAPRSPYSNRDPEKFFAELRAARASGVAWNLRERDASLCSVAAPLQAGDPPWNRAVGLALPYREWIVRDREELARQVRTLATEISVHLQRKAPGSANRPGTAGLFPNP